MTAALAAMNAEDFMIGAPAAPTALGVDYLIFQTDPDRCDYTCKLGNRRSLDGWSVTLKIEPSDASELLK